MKILIIRFVLTALLLLVVDARFRKEPEEVFTVKTHEIYRRQRLPGGSTKNIDSTAGGHMRHDTTKIDSTEGYRRQRHKKNVDLTLQIGDSMAPAVEARFISTLPAENRDSIAVRHENEPVKDYGSEINQLVEDETKELNEDSGMLETPADDEMDSEYQEHPSRPKRLKHRHKADLNRHHVVVRDEDLRLNIING